jgi:hypothetical protein
MVTLDHARLAPARLSPADLLRVGGVGLRTRPLRVVLSALGIAIGVGAIGSPLSGSLTRSRSRQNWIAPR